MKYYKISWLRKKNKNISLYPIWVYGEIDKNLWETRRVEIYSDGSSGYIDEKSKSRDDIFLAESKMTEKLLDLNADDVIKIFYISHKEFEEVWNKAVKDNAPNSDVL